MKTEVLCDPLKLFSSHIFAATNGIALPYRLYLPESYAERSEKQFPLFFYLHGNGSRGSDNEKQFRYRSLCHALMHSPLGRECIIFAPQAARRSEPGEEHVGWIPVGSHIGGADLQTEVCTDRPGFEYLFAAKELLAHMLSDYRVDTAQIFIGGCSNGASATWAMLLEHPSVFAAGVPIAPWLASEDLQFAKRLTAPAIWTFHGDADATCPVERTRRLVAAIRAAGGKNIRYTELPGVGHTGDAWTAPERTDGFFEWLFAQRNDRFVNTL